MRQAADEAAALARFVPVVALDDGVCSHVSCDFAA